MALPKGYVGVKWHLKGVYACTSCDNVEPAEREVYCWQCGTGEMVWVSGDKIAALVRKPEAPPSEAARAIVRELGIGVPDLRIVPKT